LTLASAGQQYGLSGGMSMSGVLSTRGGGSPGGYPAAATSTRGSFGALGPQSQRVPTIVPTSQVRLKTHCNDNAVLQLFHSFNEKTLNLTTQLHERCCPHSL
jgi:hypothetical protein